MDQATRENVLGYLTLSREDLETAEILLREARYRACLSRCYYAMFYAVSALLLSKGIVRSKHSGVEAALHQFFIKPGLLEADYGKSYGDAREVRELSDYEVAFVPVEGLARAHLSQAGHFVVRIEQFLVEQADLS